MQFNNENNNNNKEPQVKVLIVGGTEAVNKNLTVYEYEDEMILVDCGIGFPDIFDVHGVDVLIPDFSYLLDNSHKIKGLFITHGHEDHVGAVPHLLEELPNVPIYCSKLVQEVIKEKLTDKPFKSLAQTTSIHPFDPEKGSVKFKNFEIEAVRVNHSIPEAMGFAIKTPVGLFMHVADYKFDKEPVLDKPADLDKLKALGEQGVLCLASDCLGITHKGETPTESSLSQTFFDLFERAKGRQVFVSTLSSNLSRMYQIINAGVKYGRKIVPSGRSIESMIRIARSIGYLPFGDDVFIKEEESQRYPQEDLLYLIAGTYGQTGSSLGRLSRRDHQSIELEDNALVIFSGDPAPPGADVMVEKLTDELIRQNVEIINGEIQENLHVSGHGGAEDLFKMAELLKPKYFIPTGGSVTKMRVYRDMLNRKLNVPKHNVFELLEGENILFSKDKVKKGKRVSLQPVYISAGKEIDEISPVVIHDRNQLSDVGVFVVVIPASKENILDAKKAEIITRGFIYVKDNSDFMRKAKSFIVKKVNKNTQNGKVQDWNKFRRKMERELGRFCYKQMGVSPMILIHSIRT